MSDPVPLGGTGTQGHVPQATAEYLEPSYWDKRFEDEEEYEWFKGFDEFKHLLFPHLKLSDRLLILGCGNSNLTFDLWKEGFRDVTSVDLSEVVIRRMSAKAEALGMPSLKWLSADMLDLPFDDCSFDVVLEKGTMDVLFVDNDSPWEPRPEVCQRVHKMLGEVHRVLSASGVFLSVTFAQPHFRRPFFGDPRYTWGMRHDTFGETFHYFVYNLKMGHRPMGTAAASPKAAVVEFGKEPMTHEHMDEEGYLLCIDL